LILPSVSGGSPTNKDYFLDGPIGAYQEGSTAIIYVAARRGGNFIYAIDVSDPNNPRFKFKLSTATTGMSNLGQTWSMPKVTKVRDGTTNGKVVLIFGGGYDIAEDSNTHGTTGRGVYVVDAVLDRAGVYPGEVLTQGQRLPMSLEVKETPDAPAIGAAASRAPSPTPQTPLGVNPICTRQPACPLHRVSLSDVIGAGRPVAVLFATPALCQTRYCGPVLNELLSVRAAYEDRVTFVHVEIYRTLTGGNDESPTVQAWNIPYEPFFFTIDGSGTIRGRLDAAFGRDEITPRLEALVT